MANIFNFDHEAHPILEEEPTLSLGVLLYFLDLFPYMLEFFLSLLELSSFTTFLSFPFSISAHRK